jgi:hypothetical protein
VQQPGNIGFSGEAKRGGESGGKFGDGFEVPVERLPFAGTFRELFAGIVGVIGSVA